MALYVVCKVRFTSRITVYQRTKGFSKYLIQSELTNFGIISLRILLLFTMGTFVLLILVYFAVYICPGMEYQH